MPAVCSVCDYIVKENERVSCDFCKSLLPGACVSSSRSETTCLNNPNRKINFFCKDTVRIRQNEMQMLKNEIDGLKNAAKNQGDTSSASNLRCLMKLKTVNNEPSMSS